MKTGWEVKRLGDVCENLDGKRVPVTKKFRSEGKYPYYGASGIVDYVDEFIFDDNLLLVSEDGANLLTRTYPIAFSISGRAWVNNHAHVLRFKNIASQHFVEYYLNSILLNDYVSGMAQPKLNQRMLNSIPIPYPDLEVQQRIVAILDEAFAAIDQAKANAEKNLQNARELFESYLQSVFANPGERWEEKRIGDVCKTQYGLSESMNTEANGFKIFRMGEVQNGLLIDTGKMKYASISRGEFEKYRLNDGDILFNRTNSYELVGKTGIFKLQGEYCFASYLIRLKYDPKRINPWFLNHLMNSSGFQKEIKKKAAKSVNQANINATILSNEKINIPPLEQQQSIVAKLDSLSTETKKLEAIYRQKLADLDELKKAILQKAFRGELKTAQAAELV